MFLVGNFLAALAAVLDWALFFFVLVLFGRVVSSWLSADPRNPLVRFLYGATEPLLRPIRRRLPSFGGIDWSPIVLFLGIYFLQIFLVNSLQDVAVRLR